MSGYCDKCKSRTVLPVTEYEMSTREEKAKEWMYGPAMELDSVNYAVAHVAGQIEGERIAKEAFEAARMDSDGDIINPFFYCEDYSAKYWDYEDWKEEKEQGK